jgi:hypothetical protein
MRRQFVSDGGGNHALSSASDGARATVRTFL